MKKISEDIVKAQKKLGNKLVGKVVGTHSYRQGSYMRETLNELAFIYDIDYNKIMQEIGSLIYHRTNTHEILFFLPETAKIKYNWYSKTKVTKKVKIKR